ncbi:MAG: SIMPL domain-containing protein [Nitrososphaerota archaeon]|nr:SIMPL domain-containing protein [Nitrososphaerota archaeon]
MTNLALVAAVVALAIGFVLVSTNSRTINVNMGGPGTEYNVITITGSASMKVVPDEGRLQVGVLTRGQTASEAMRSNSEVSNRVVSALKGIGLADRDLRTSGVSVNPEYDCSSGQCVLKGYVATNTLEVTLRGEFVRRAGEVIDEAVEAGSNLIYGISFTVSTERKRQLSQDLMRAAVSDARSKAELLTRELGLRIVGVASVSVNLQEPMPVVPTAVEARGAELRSTPVSPGELTVWAQVTVSFKIE